MFKPVFDADTLTAMKYSQTMTNTNQSQSVGVHDYITYDKHQSIYKSTKYKHNNDISRQSYLSLLVYTTEEDVSM